MKLNEKIKNLRKQAKLSQEELAEKLHVSRQTVFKWEAGKSIPDTDNVVLMSKLFQVPLEELLYDDCDCDCCDDDDYECDGNCCDCDEDCELADDDFFEVECPACGEVICFDGSIDPEELACPACGEKFECIIAQEDLEVLDAE